MISFNIKICFVILSIFCMVNSQHFPDKFGALRGRNFPTRKSLNLFSRINRSAKMPVKIIDADIDCVLVTAESGEFFFKASSSDEKVCGVYMMSEPDTTIVLQFQYLDVPCESGGLVAWIDGWEMNGEIWPPLEPTESDDRVFETCGPQRPTKAFQSSQNAALLQYRVPHAGKGFAISVKHVKSSKPCNQLVYGAGGVYTLSNYGTDHNCTLLSVSPAAVSVLALDVGRSVRPRFNIDTGVLYQCEKRGLPDHLDIGGSTGLDTNRMFQLENICGLSLERGMRQVKIACESAVIRLTSSGYFFNKAVISLTPLTEQDFMTADLICPLEAPQVIA